ncbi:MAG: PcfB family protein [Clostridiales bacterium]|nr:PcfB family protein [Clostridiales bacterium]
MSMEAETGEMIVRVAFDGLERTLRITGSAGLLTGKLLIFLAAALSKGKAKDIALNPGGICMVTVPEKSLKDFARLAKKYHLQYFVAKDKLHEAGLQDICIRAEDAGVVNRICEKMGINAIERGNGSIENVTDFNKAAEVKKQVSVSFDRALNRITEKDFSKDTPRYICERTNPANYIELKSSYENYNGEQYTKTRYTVYKEGEKIGEYNDGRFDGRERGYWQSQKEKMRNAAGFTDDIVFFDEAEEFNHYRKLQEIDAMPSIPAGELKDKAEKEIREFMVGEGTSKNPQKASEVGIGKASEAGARDTKKEEGSPIHKYVNEYKAKDKQVNRSSKVKAPEIVR